MALPVAAVAAIVSAAIAAAKGIAGAVEKGKAKRAMAKLKDPFYKIQDEYFQNRNIAGSEAQFGLPSATLNQFIKGAGTGLGSAISAANQVGGGVNDIGRMLQGYTDSLGSTAGQDAMLHTQKIQEFMNRNRELAGQKTMQYVLNEKQPLENKLRQLQQNSIVGQQNMWGGASDFGAAAANYGTAMQNQDLINAMKNNNGSSMVNMTPTQVTMPNWVTASGQNNQFTDTSSDVLNPTSNRVDVNSLSDQQVSDLLRRMNFLSTKR